MADGEKEGGGTTSRGAEWEVVSLTASAYAAAPGPKEIDPAGASENKQTTEKEQDPSAAMFMSDHFVFPPNEHENLPIEPEHSEIQDDAENQDGNPTEDIADEASDSHREYLRFKPADDLQGVQYSDKESSVSVYEMEAEGGKGLHGLNLLGEDQVLLVPPEFSAFHAETDGPDSEDSSSPNSKKEAAEDFDGSGLPCEAWWKRHATCIYRHAKEANTFWSIFVAAALVGLVILGRRWQREKLQLQQLNWHLHVNNERMHRFLGPIGRFKHVLLGGHHCSPLIRGSGPAVNL